MRFYFKYDTGDFVIYNSEILTIKSFGYFWEDVCELSNETCCRLRNLTPLSKFSDFTEEEMKDIIRNSVYRNFIRSLVPSTE